MNTTQVVIAASVVLLLGYDVFAFLRAGLHNTISWQIVALSKEYPSIPFALGFLMGHLFGQM